MPSQIDNPDVVDRCVDVLYDYVAGDRTFVLDDPEAEQIMTRLCRNYNSPVLENVTHETMRIYCVLHRMVAAYPRPDPAHQDETLRKLFVCKSRITAASKLGLSRNQFYDSVSQHWDPLLDFKFVDNSDAEDKFQKAVKSVLGYCAQRMYRIHGDSIYEPVKIGGVFCRCFRAVPHDTKEDTPLSALDLVASRVPNDPQNPDAFKSVCIQAFKAVASYLPICNAPELPVLRKNYRLYAFRNCLYDVERDVIYRHDEPIDANLYPGMSMTACKFIDLDLDWTPDQSQGLFPSPNACVADSDFPDDPNDFMSIHTPIVDALFDWQWPQSPEEQELLPAHLRTTDPRLLKRFMMAMFGRLLYKQNELDNFETILMIVGVKGCGKSSIIGLFDGLIYEPDDVAIMTGTSESTFGISQLDGKRIMLVAECGQIGVKNGKGLNEDDLLKLASSDRCEIRAKFQTPRAALLRPAMLMVGNLVPRWDNAECAMSRRVVYAR